MAHAQRLSDQVKNLSGRVHELEVALAQAQSQNGAIQQQSQGATTVKDESYEETIAVVSDAIGSLSIGVDGQAKYHGESAGSEYLQQLLPFADEDWLASEPKHLDLPSEIIDLMNAFPFGLKDCPYSKMLFVPYLPHRDRAMELADLYYTTAAWMYDPIVREDFVSILDTIYGNSGYANLDNIHGHRLSAFFIVLANGILYDTHPSSPTISEQYHALARAAMSLDSMLNEATCATVQALFMMFRFIYNSDRSSNEERWLLTGMCARVAQSVPTSERDSAGWNLAHDEVQRRRRLFWELFVWDSWSGVVVGRPSALMIQHTDCRFPEDTCPSVAASGETELGWHAWKFRYSATCLSISVQHIFSTKAPSYAALLDIDRRIRKFPIPNHLRSPLRASDGRVWSSDASHAMQQYCALCVRESNLLYIHRSYFAQAIRDDSTNPLGHKYAPSVLATFRSACRLISSLKTLHPLYPTMVSHVWFFWSGIFSSCIVLGALVVESPGCTLAQDAICELEQALPFYEEGSKPCRPPATLPMLQKLCVRAATTFSSFKAGMGDAKTLVDPNRPDELEVLGGRKTVINQSNPNSPSHTNSGSEADGGSPASHAGAAEMLMEYYEELATSGYDIKPAQDYEMRAPGPSYIPFVAPTANIHHQESQPHTSQPHTQPHVPQRQVQSQPHQQALPQSHPHHVHHQLSANPRSIAPRSEPMQQVWYPTYPTPHHLHPAPQSPGSAYPVQYGAMDMHNHHPYVYPAQEQNQDDIWRSFVSEFGSAT
ncbi:hypothetical protein BD779DRAFT_1437104 [Infundibulicybe gibba]|nr:hypothetical protein BD779DRAFT_1437104 [Infundibulicybe gibba]